MQDFDVKMNNQWQISDCSAPDIFTVAQADETLRVKSEANILTITALDAAGAPKARIYGRKFASVDATDLYVILPTLPPGVADGIYFRANGAALVFAEDGLHRLRAVGTDTNSGECGGWIFNATELTGDA